MLNLPKEGSAGLSNGLLLSRILFSAKPLGRLPVEYEYFALSSSYFQQLAFLEVVMLSTVVASISMNLGLSLPSILHHLISVDDLAF